MALIIDGTKIASVIREEIKEEIKKLKEKYKITPGLAVVLIGDNPASVAYVGMKEKACKELGIFSTQHTFPADAKDSEILKLIGKLNKDKKIHGILIQMPLPVNFDEKKFLFAIDPSKDVDCFHPMNVGKIMIGEGEVFLPATPYGIQQLLVRSGIEIKGKHVVVVGRSNIVGKPIAMMLMQKKQDADATVTVCHSRTKDIANYTRQADILIVAMGKPYFIKADMVKDGVVVIDVGSNKVDDKSSPRGFRFVGDVDFDNVSKKASAITPVPKGVGPMTITMLLNNVLKSAKLNAGIL